MTDEQKPQDANEGTMGPSRSTAGLEMRPPPVAQMPQEAADAIARMVATVESPKAPDEMVWLNIYCAVANCFNSEKPQAVSWADEGLREFRKRFRL